MENRESSPKTAFVDYLYESVSVAIEQWDDATSRDAYAVWLMLSLGDDDVRFTELSGVGYSTHAHTTPELAKSYGSKWSPYCIAHETVLSLCHPSDAELVEIYGIEDKHDARGCELRDAFLDVAAPRFNRSDREATEVREHSQLQAKLNQNPTDFSPQEAARLHQLSLQFGLSETEQIALQSDADLLPQLYQNAILGAFLEVCGAVIRRLHGEGLIEHKCGRAIPVGIAFSNDVDARVVLETLRTSNPPGLSREIEEEIIGRTYVQIEAEEILLAQLAAQSFDEQADFWAELLLSEAQWLYLGLTSPATQRIEELGLRGFGAVGARAAANSEVAGRVVSRLIPAIEESASPLAPALHENERRGKQSEIASALLGAITQIGENAGNRDAVREEDVERLHTVLSRLFHESETLERVGYTTFLVARTLHALRPERFPHEKFGSGGSTGNRLLNYRAFGLAKQDPTTPDYDEAADEKRRAARRSRLV